MGACPDHSGLYRGYSDRVSGLSHLPQPGSCRGLGHRGRCSLLLVAHADTTRHWQAAAIVGVAVFSHYPLDVLVHVPDLPIYGDDSAKLGLGLWNNPTATNIAEFLVFGIGLGLYVTLKSHRHPVRIGRLALLAVVLVGTYLASLYGPQPSSMTTIAVSAIVFILGAAALAGWADRRATPQELQAQHLSQR